MSNISGDGHWRNPGVKFYKTIFSFINHLGVPSNHLVPSLDLLPETISSHIRSIRWKGLPGTNDLAYYKRS